jgi:UDP-2-acetamido-2-deoxy-ribo-hexuluronate aminotransferase
MDFIDLKTQYSELKESIDSRIEAVHAHGRYILGPEVQDLEARLQSYTGAKHCVSVSSGTDALLISLMALGIGPGDEVITTPFTFVATAEVIALLGATPVFVDIEPDTCNIQASSISNAMTSRTRAIMPVSLYGQPADMDEICALAKAHGTVVIEDAAQSLGATFQGKRSCNLSHIGCTSFFPSKPLGCYGDGGALFTNDDSLAETARELRVHGQARRYHHTRVGIGGRLDTIQAAVLLAKLDRFDWETDRRVKIGQRYNALLDAAGIERVQIRSDRTSVHAQFTVFVEDRDRIAAHLKTRGIPTAVHYPVPLCDQPAYRDLGRQVGDLPQVKERARTVLSLPMHPYLADDTIAVVVDALQAASRHEAAADGVAHAP